MSGQTAIHRMVEQCRSARYAAAVTKMSSGWVVMGERQVFQGYCLLLPDPVVGHLNDMAPPQRVEFLADMALVGDALIACTGALRINYAMYGNVEPALHAHLFPRFADEPVETRTAQPWAFDWSMAPAFDETAHGALKRRIRLEIERRAGPFR